MKKKGLIAVLTGLILVVTMFFTFACGDGKINELQLKPDKLSLMVGESVKLKVTAPNKSISINNFKFTTSNKDVATVTDDGTVSAVAAGEATITATSKTNENVKAQTVVIVSGSRIVKKSNGDMVINWEVVDGAVSYDIYHSGSRLGEKTLLGNTTDTTFTHKSPNEVKYENYYTVVPKDNMGNTIVKIKWNNVDSAQSFRVERGRITQTPSGPQVNYTTIDTVTERSLVDFVPDYDFDLVVYIVNPLNQSGEIIKSQFDPDSPSHTKTDVRLRGFQITRNIVIKYEYPITISLERELFGEDVYFYDAKYDDMADILADINRIADAMRASSNAVQMSAERFALYFKPGNYPLEGSDARGARLDVGFYMTVAGLGLLPTDTRIGATVYTPPALGHGNNNGDNGTHNFWRAIENFEIYRPQGAPAVTLGWAVSQAAPMRRLYVAQGVGTNYNMNGGWVSGGFAADIYFGGSVNGGGQQQFYTRNSYFSTEMQGVSWNNFVIASTGDDFKSNYMTGGSKTWVAESIDEMKEKPFLYYDTNENEYKIFVPGLRKDALGPSWTPEDPGVGESISRHQLYVVKPGDTAQKINKILDNGFNLFLSPGMYECEVPIYVKKEGTLVLGTGLATISPTQNNSEGAMLVSDVSGVTLAGFICDASANSKYILRVGEVGSNKDHSDNPTFISDVFARVGGYKDFNTNAEVSVDIHSNNVIGDHFWIWLADHGRATGWERNKGAFGLVVHGDDVTMHGLFVEHYQKYQTLWLGERGRVFFYQNELPYTVPNQDAWMSRDEVKGWAAFKVADNVNEFYGIGFGIYSTLRNANIFLDNAIEAPNGKEGVKFEALYANNISASSSGILNVINGAGGRAVGTDGKRIAVFNGSIAKQYSSGQLRELNTIAPVPENYSTLLEKIY